MATYESCDDAQPYEHRPDDGDQPEDMLLRRPAVPEQTNGNEHRPWDHRWQSILWLHLPLGRLLLHDEVRRYAKSDQAHDRSDADAKIRESDGSLREAIGAFEHFRDGGEEKVEIAVRDGHESRQSQNNGRQEKHLRRTNDRSDEEILRGEARVQFRHELLVARLFAKPARFPL